MATNSKRLVRRIGAAVSTAKHEVEAFSVIAERNVKRGLKDVASRVKHAASKVEKALSPKKRARRAATPGETLDKGIARARRAASKAGGAARKTGKRAIRKPARRRAARA